MGPLCQHGFGLGLRLKKALREADLLQVRAAVFLFCATAVALFVHPGDTGDLPFFLAAAHRLFSADWANVFADPSVQVGPLQLVVFRLGDSVGALSLVVEVGAAALIWVVAGRLVGRRAQFAVSLVAVALGLTYSAYSDGHLAQLVVPLLWVLSALEARRGRGVRAGVLIGLSAGFELWGLAVLAAWHRTFVASPIAVPDGPRPRPLTL